MQKEEEREDGQLLQSHSGEESSNYDRSYKRDRSQLYPYEMTLRQLCDKKHQTQKSKQQLCVILFCMFLMTLTLSLLIFYQDWIRMIILKLDVAQLQIHNGSSTQGGDNNFYKILSYKVSSANGIDNSIYNLCPNSTSVFHTYYNETDKKMRYLDQEFLKKSKKCNISVIGFENLKQLRRRWDLKFPQHKITLGKFQNMQDKQLLLILLQLYFHAGTFMNITIPYSRISDRCWKYALTGYNILFADFEEETAEGVVVPDMRKFMKARFPFSVQIKNIIQRLISSRDVLEECRKEQCLVIKCFDQ